MNRQDIDNVLAALEKTREKNLVIIDFGNVEKWKESLGWKIGIKELKNLIKHLTYGKKFLRRFYYGSDYGKHDRNQIMTMWSANIMNKARMNDFEIITKRVKYIPSTQHKTSYIKKCDFDVEIAVDTIREQKNYDTCVIFSGDGDMAYLLRHLKECYNKSLYVFAARNHIGRELIDAEKEGIIEKILYADDFEYRLNMDRFINP